VISLTTAKPSGLKPHESYGAYGTNKFVSFPFVPFLFVTISRVFAQPVKPRAFTTQRPPRLARKVRSRTWGTGLITLHSKMGQLALPRGKGSIRGRGRLRHTSPRY